MYIGKNKKHNFSHKKAHYSCKRIPSKTQEDVFVTVHRRKRRQRANRNHCGTAPLEPDVTVCAAKPNTPVYIFRLHYTNAAEGIVEYVRRRTKHMMTVQLLESHRNVNWS